MTFVKSQNTEVPASRSQAELERVLRRYGATGFGVQSDYEKGLVRIFFRVPDSPGELASVPVRLEVDIKAVSVLLNGDKKSGGAIGAGHRQAMSNASPRNPSPALSGWRGVIWCCGSMPRSQRQRLASRKCPKRFSPIRWYAGKMGASCAWSNRWTQWRAAIGVRF